jgi:CBS domain-containing protein
MQGQAQTQAQPRMMRPQFQPSTVEELIQTDVVTAQRDTPIASVVSAMRENEVGSVLVVDDDGETPIDVVTDRKIALTLEDMPDLAERNVEELVTGDLVTGTSEMSVFEAIDALNKANVRRLPVIDEEGALQGIVTMDDLLVFFCGQFDDMIEVVAAQRRG